MFVRASKYKKLLVQNRELIDELYELKKSGNFVDSYVVGNIKMRDNVWSMVKLCHPDRHSNSELSNKITAMLLEVLNERR